MASLISAILGVMKHKPFEEVEHTADWAMRVRGDDLASLLRNAALGMLHMSEALPAEDRGRRHKIKLEAPDAESLLVVWLEELLFRMETCGVTYPDIAIQTLEGMRLVAEVREVPLASIAKHIKAVTFHNLDIQTTPEGLETTIVFDV
jgi:SHS2 domain-containing protein